MTTKDHKSHKSSRDVDHVRDIDHNSYCEDDVICAEDIIRNFPFMDGPDFFKLGTKK